jgi:L,D-transpeptidase ErfK/SrfK
MTYNSDNILIMDASQNIVEVSSAKLSMNSKLSSISKWLFTPIKILLFIGVFVSLFVLSIPKIQEMPFRNNLLSFMPISVDTVTSGKINSDLEKHIKKLEAKLASKTPKTPYITISTVKNEYVLYKKQKAIRSGKCSTGSYVLLDGGAKQRWMFRTPKGEFHIHGKTTDPVWKKPDWAFVEEGLKIPSPNHSSRYEYGVLGDYALSLGDGYMLHGTLYKRYLGLAVTHGCVRLNDDDLEAIFKTLDIGSKVYIF